MLTEMVGGLHQEPTRRGFGTVTPGCPGQTPQKEGAQTSPFRSGCRLTGASFKEVPETEELLFTGEQLATASSIGSETGRKKPKAVRGRIPGKKKK
jgi:hypothetical protein